MEGAKDHGEREEMGTRRVKEEEKKTPTETECTSAIWDSTRDCFMGKASGFVIPFISAA